jgi:hypothetical protein
MRSQAFGQTCSRFGVSWLVVSGHESSLQTAWRETSCRWIRIAVECLNSAPLMRRRRKDLNWCRLDVADELTMWDDGDLHGEAEPPRTAQEMHLDPVGKIMLTRSAELSIAKSSKAPTWRASCQHLRTGNSPRGYPGRYLMFFGVCRKPGTRQ